MICATDTFNTLHQMGTLFQQNVVNMYAKVKSDRLMFLRHNQAKLWSELYQGIGDVIDNSTGNINGSQIGKRVILPSSCYRWLPGTNISYIKMQWVL